MSVVGNSTLLEWECQLLVTLLAWSFSGSFSHLEWELSELPDLTGALVVVGIGEASARLRNIGASKRDDIS